MTVSGARYAPNSEGAAPSPIDVQPSRRLRATAYSATATSAVSAALAASHSVLMR